MAALRNKGFEMSLGLIIGLIIAAVLIIIVIAVVSKGDGGFVKGLFGLIGVKG